MKLEAIRPQVPQNQMQKRQNHDSPDEKRVLRLAEIQACVSTGCCLALFKGCKSQASAYFSSPSKVLSDSIRRPVSSLYLTKSELFQLVKKQSFFTSF